MGRIKLFLVAAILLAAIKISRGWHWSAGLFFAYIWVHFIQSGMKEYASLDIILITATFFLIPEICKTIKSRVFEDIILGIGALHVFTSILNLYGINILEVTNDHYIKSAYLKTLPTGLLGQHTLLASYLCFAFCISLYRFMDAKYRMGRICYGGISIIFLAIIAVSESTMAYLAVGSIALVFTLFYRSFWSAVGVMGLGFASLIAANFIYPEIFSLSGRAAPWQDALNLIPAKPYFGFGLGSWSVIAMELAKIRNTEGSWYQLHSDLLQAVFEWGFVGLSFIVMFFGKILFKVRDALAMDDRAMIPYIAGLASFLVTSLGSFTMHVTPHGQLAAFCAFVILQQAGSAERLCGRNLLPR